MDSPPLDNLTDFVVHPQPLIGKDGEQLVTMVKATWELARGESELHLAPKERVRGIRPGDVPWGTPGETSVMLPSDLCIRKPGTDVIVTSRGYASGGTPVGHFDVSARVGPVNKVLRIFGLRVWQSSGQGLSDPRPISELDLRYEFAWGGADFNDDGDAEEEPRNPMGMGVTLDPDSLTHQAAPHIEDPFDLISSRRTRPQPAGVGPIGRWWEPRRSYCGTYDEKWLDERAPLLPADEDDRVNLCASPGLIAETPLMGGEDVVLAGMKPGGGTTSFCLPRVGVEIEVKVDDRQPEVFHPTIDTVVIDQLLGATVGLPTVELVWRAAVKAPRRMKAAHVIVRQREVR